MSLASKGLTPGFLPLAEAAQWAGVSPRTMKRWISKGLAYFQEGPRTKELIRPGDIEIFLNRRQVERAALDMMVDTVMSELQG